MWVCAKLDFDLEGNFQGQMWWKWYFWVLSP
jgi:hypothetical protein